MSIVFWVSLANLFIRSSAMFQLNLYISLFMFLGYIVVDTQVCAARGVVRAGVESTLLTCVHARVRPSLSLLSLSTSR